jgi:hypothetical protein
VLRQNERLAIMCVATKLKTSYQTFLIEENQVQPRPVALKIQFKILLTKPELNSVHDFNNKGRI